MKVISAYMANRNARRDDDEERRREIPGRYMADEEIMPESRYRGRDGRWKAGRRRSEYDGGMRMEYNEGNEEPVGSVSRWPYAPTVPHMPAKNRMIGFDTRPEYETRSHYDIGKAAAKVGGTMWMEPIGEEDEAMELDRVTAERWVQGMKNEDPARPKGPRWSMEEVKPHALKFGVETEGDELVEFWAVMNAMFSDYAGVAKRFNITSPEFYALMAKAWMDDKDAVPNKTAMYYKCCVKKE